MAQEIIFDYSLLKGKIKEKFDSNKNFAKKLGISEATLSYKLNHKIQFSQSEIIKIVELLDVNKEDINKYFFNTNVRN